MKIGLFGGTFDPPHRGHLAVARAAQEHLELDEVLFIPAYRNPLKSAKTAPAKDRLEMVRLAIQGQPNFAYSDVEISRGGPSYMIETLMEFSFARPAEYWIILGADSLKSFREWRSWERIPRMARLAVAMRPPLRQEQFVDMPSEVLAAIDWVPMNEDPVSSTDIRLRLGEKRVANALLPANVLNYIEKNKLYQP